MMRHPVYSLLLASLALMFIVSCGGGGGGTVGPPLLTADFSLASNPGSLTVNRSISWTTNVTVSGTNGFTGSVSLATTGLPAGVSASFNPASTTTTSVLTLTASGAATLGAATVTVTGTSGALTHNTTLNLTVGPDDNAGFTYNGFDHISFNANEYSSAAGNDSRTTLAASGSNWSGVLATWYQANATATSIAASSFSPSDAAVVAAIQDLHAKNIKVMLKPHVDSLDGVWRGTFHQNSSGEADAWFASYTTFITHYAQMAHDNNVEMLCVGTELVQLTGSANATRWANVITAIRGVYPTGLLTYASNAVGSADEFTTVSFWDNPEISLIGLDAYTPLTNLNNPTIAQLVAGWTFNANGDNPLAAYHNVSLAHGKPIIFTEIGYRSVDGANKAPFDFSAGSTFDAGEQHDCYEAMYEVWSQQSFMQGVFWWDWGVPTPGANDTGYDVRGKPAEVVVRDWQN